MNPELLFHFVMIGLMGACMLVCGIAGICELIANDPDRRIVRLRRRHKKTRAVRRRAAYARMVRR
jgi:hypothetical protein